MIEQGSTRRGGNETQAEIQKAIEEAQRAVQDARQDALEAARQARAAAQGAGRAGRPSNADARPGQNVIVIPNDGGEDVRISVDGQGVHLSQGDRETIIPVRDIVPRGAVQMTYALSAALIAIAVVGPIVRFVLRRWDKRLDNAVISAAVQARLDAMDRNIDTVALEMERVSEGQRFTSKLLEQRPMEHAQRSDR